MLTESKGRLIVRFDFFSLGYIHFSPFSENSLNTSQHRLEGFLGVLFPFLAHLCYCKVLDVKCGESGYGRE
jgi:hypothetical protein